MIGNRVLATRSWVLSFKLSWALHTTSLEEMRCGNSGSVDLRNQTRGCECGVGARDETVGVAQRNISLIMKPSYQ